MSDVQDRLSRMPPEQRAELLRLLRARQAGAQAPAPPRAPADHAARAYHWNDVPPKTVMAQLYDEYHESCNATFYGRYSYFMNVGYAEDDNPQHSPVALPPHMVNRNSVKLVLETIGDRDLNDRDVLDVGCGRGGTIHVVHTFYRPRTTVGLDISPGAIAFCQAQHRYHQARFLVGDAENLPLADRSFDYVLNIESAHLYPDMRAFFREVRRVLRPGGALLFGGLLYAAELDGFRAFWHATGFALERDQDITSNVMKSRQQLADTQFAAHAELHREAGDDAGQQARIANAMAAPGSDWYEALRTGALHFRAVRLRRVEDAA